MSRHNIFAATTGPFRGAKLRHAKPFIEKELRAWLFAMKIKTLYIEPGSPWLPSEATPQRAKTRITNGFIEAFHNHLPDKCLNSDVLLNVSEAQVVIEQWLQTYNNEHLHSRLGFKSPPRVCQILFRSCPRSGYALTSPRYLLYINPNTINTRYISLP